MCDLMLLQISTCFHWFFTSVAWIWSFIRVHSIFVHNQKSFPGWNKLHGAKFAAQHFDFIIWKMFHVFQIYESDISIVASSPQNSHSSFATEKFFKSLNILTIVRFADIFLTTFDHICKKIYQTINNNLCIFLPVHLWQQDWGLKYIITNLLAPSGALVVIMV